MCEIEEAMVKESAIDVALENNQVVAIKILIDHVICHQNSFIFSFLFSKNLVHLMEKGVEVSNLLNSNIFYFEFDFQSWPSIHENP